MLCHGNEGGLWKTDKAIAATDLAPSDTQWHLPLAVTLLKQSVFSPSVNSQTNNILNVTQQDFLSLKLYEKINIYQK